MPAPKPKSKPVHERQIEIARNEKSKLVNGLIEKITSLALNSEKVKKKLVEVVCRGLDQYSLSLLKQVDRIGKTKLNLNSSNFKLTKDDIEALKGINDTQRLLLHQVLNNNIIRDNIQKLSTGSYELENILNLLQGVEDLNQYASHMAKFPEYDPDSFRKFQILNNYSYSLFVRTIYDETLHKNQDHLATTLNQYIQDLIDKINEDTSDSAPHVYEHDSLQYQDALVQNFMEAIKEVLRGSEKDHEKIVRAIQDKIPSLLQISNDSINEKQLKQSVNELLDLEELTGDFHLTVEYFNSYFEACYPIRTTDPKESRRKTAADKEKAVEKIRSYIEYIREIRKDDHIQRELLEIKNERLKLSEIKNNIKKLQVQELFSSSVMPDGSEEEFTAILSRLSELGYDKLTELLSTYSDFVKDNKEKLIAFKIQYSIPGNVDLLIKLLESKLDRKNFSPRAQYYEGLLKTIDQNLAQKDAKTIEYVNVKTDHAVTICNNPDECGSEVISDDKASVIPTNVFNPLVHKMAKHMPRDMADKLKIFNEIENEITVTEKILADGKELRTLDGNDSIAIRSAYDNLEKTRAVLIKKSRIIETDILKFTVGKIALLVQDQKDLFLQDHKDRLDAIISPISLEEKQQLDQNLQDETKELFKTLNKLNEKLSDSANFSRDMIISDLLKLEHLILQLESKKFTGKRKFDFSEVSSDLKKLNKYYKNVPPNRLAGIERDATSIKYTSEKDLVTSLIGYGKFITQVIDFFRAVYHGFKVTISAITYGFNQIFGLLFRTFARMSSNNQQLLKMIDQLEDKVQKSDRDKQFKAKLLEDIDIMRSKVGRLTAKTSSIVEEFEALQSRFSARDTTKTEVEVDANTTDMTVSDLDSDEETDILASSLPESPISPTANEHAELIARLMEQTPTDAAAIAKDACHQFTVPKAKELIHHKIETISLDVNTKLTDLQHQLTEQLAPERRDQAKIEVLAAQIRTLENTQFELSNIAKEFDSLKDKLHGDDTVQGLDKVERSLKKVEYHLRLYESTATAIERMYHALSAFLKDESPEKAATEVLLKNVLKEVSEQSKDPTSTASSIARSALLGALDKAPSVVQAVTGKLGVTHEMRACKHIIDSTFNAAIDALKNQKDIQGIKDACQHAAAQSLIEETARLGVVLVGTEQPGDAEADKQFKKKIKKLSQSMSTLSLEIFAANQGFHMLLLMVDRHPNLRPLLEQTLNRVCDVATQALKDGKTYEEIVSAAKMAMIQEIKTVLRDAPVTHKPKIMVHEAPEELGSRIKSSLRQLAIEIVALREQEEKLTTQAAPDETNKELLRGQLIKIQLQIKEKSESTEKIKQIQDKFEVVLADEAALNRIAEAYPDGAERYQLIYRVEKYEPIKKRKIELEQELDEIVSPGLLAQVHSFIEQLYATSSLPTQEAINAVFRNVVIAVSDSLEKGDVATDTAIKGLDVALQGWVDVMKMLSFASGERGKAIEDLIKTSIEAAVKANHNDPRATVDLNFLAKQAVIKALEEIQKDDFLNKITINFCQGTQKELVLIGAKAAINKLKEENSTLSEAKDIFLLAVSQNVHSVWAPNPIQLAVRLLLPQAAPLVSPQKAATATTTTITPTATIPDQQSMISQVSNYFGSFFNNTKASPPSKSDPNSNPTARPVVPQ